MGYLFVQTGIWLLFAAILGLFIGWLIWGRNSGDDCSAIQRQLDECRKRCTGLEAEARAAQEKAETSESSSMTGGASQFVDTSIDNNESTEAVVESASESVDEASGSDDNKPVFLSEPDGDVDDLKKISGVGPVLEKTLNGLGIFHFKQIAEFTRENIEWVDNYLSFTGRIDREDWVGQAKKLSAGESTDFSNRYEND